jgi:hypothetical protein
MVLTVGGCKERRAEGVRDEPSPEKSIPTGVRLGPRITSQRIVTLGGCSINEVFVLARLA